MNVKGVYFAAQAAAKAFGDRGGSIVNISSVVSCVGPNGTTQYTLKTASKIITQMPAKIRAISVLLENILQSQIHRRPERIHCCFSIMDDSDDFAIKSCNSCHIQRFMSKKSNLQDIAIARDHFVEHGIDEEAEEESRDQACDNYDRKGLLRV